MSRPRCAGPVSLCLLAALAPAASGQLLDLDAWHTVSSRNFTIWTDATPERGAEIARNLELFRSVFALHAPRIELRAAVPTTFIAFRDGPSYDPYKSQPDRDGAVLLGQFLIHPDRNFLTFDASAGLSSGFDVIYHEFVHTLIAHNFARVPRWFHEGLAEYYSTFAVEGDTLVVGRPVERHLRWLRYDNSDRKERSLSHDFSLRAVLTGESGRHGVNVGGYYAMSWALIHYLLSGEPERLDRLADFLVRMRDGEDPDVAFERAFDVQIDDLEETLRAYVLRRPGLGVYLEQNGTAFPVVKLDVADLEPVAAAVIRPAAAAAVLYRLGDLQLRLGRPAAAESHFHTALERAPSDAESLAGLAVLRDLESRFDEAGVLFGDAIANGTTDPLTFVRYGRHLLARMVPEGRGALVAAGKLVVAGELAAQLIRDQAAAAAEALAAAARDAFAAAVRLDGDYAEARALFGYAHLFGETDPGPGIAALQKARSLLPDRQDFTLTLLQLYLQDQGFDRARRLVATDLADHAEPELVLQAEEEIERARLLHRASEALAEGEVEEALRLFDQAIAMTSDQELRDRMAERLSLLQRRHGAH